MGKNWFALYTKPRKEEFVIRQLSFNKIAYFYPTIRNKKGKIVPYFPRYVFVHVNSNKIKDPIIKWMPGVIEIVNFDGRNAIIPDYVILSIKQHISEIHDSKNELMESFKEGDEVIITDGPFEGYRGIFDLSITSRERVKVLLKLLSDQSTKIELRVDQIHIPK